MFNINMKESRLSRQPERLTGNVWDGLKVLSWRHKNTGNSGMGLTTVPGYLKMCKIVYFRGMSERLEAHFQNRTYYFYLTDRKPEVFTISMYNFSYTLIKSNGKWRNHPGNKMEMTGGLVVAVAIAVGEPMD